MVSVAVELEAVFIVVGRDGNGGVMEASSVVEVVVVVFLLLYFCYSSWRC